MASLELPPDRTAPSRARHFVAETLRAWGCGDAIADAELLVSELVTNAVLHARSAAVVTLDQHGAGIRVSVCDTSSAMPRVRDYGPGAVTGRGMLLVDRLSQRWGVDMAEPGKCVWFELNARRDGDLRAEA